MIVTLFDRNNPPKQERWFTPQGVEQASTSALLLAAMPGCSTLHHVSNETYTAREGAREVGVNLLIQTLNYCYDQHVSFSFAPEVAWYMITNAVAETVRQDPGTYAHLFTTKPGEKQKVKVYINHFIYGQPNDWTQGIAQFDAELRKLVPDGIMDHMLPKFSTATPVSNVALLLSFMDAASPFYEYEMMTLCGIPSIRLEGTAEDWRLVRTKAQALSEVIPTLRGYFDALLPVLDEIAATASGKTPDLRFWSNIFKLDGGSGGPYVNGWITTFFAYGVNTDWHTKEKITSLRKSFGWEQTALRSFGGWKTNQFPLHIAGAEFTWVYYDQEYPMQFAAGILDVKQDGEFLSPRLGFAVLERAR